MLLMRTPRDVHEAMHNSLSVHVLSRILMIFTFSAQHVPMTQGKALSLSLSPCACPNPWFWLQHVPSHHTVLKFHPRFHCFFRYALYASHVPLQHIRHHTMSPHAAFWNDICHFSLLHPISRALRSNAQHPTCQSISRFLLRIMSLHAGFWIAIHAIATLFLMYLLI